MSTTFQVFSSSLRTPSYAELLEIASDRLASNLESRCLAFRPALRVSVLSNDNNTPIPFSLSDELTKSLDTFAWFYINGGAGGTDFYYCPLDIEYREDLLDELRGQPEFQAKASLITKCLEANHFWYFRRSMGQPASICVAYGILAAALAELTDGFVYSSDGAWDVERFPAVPSELYEWYFRPEYALEDGTKQWASGTVDYIRREFNLK